MFCFRASVALLGLARIATSISLSPRNDSTTSCRCFPGDACWPSSQQWASFNKTVGGQLVATVPIASACHNGFPGVSYDAEKCAYIQANWDEPTLHDMTSSSPMAPIFANMSCDPFTAIGGQCIIGSYVPYAVNASSASDYIQTLAFAKQYNIRLVIRNTGHDYMGKSTGAGALALWTHHLKDIEVFNYSSQAYTGPAMTVGAGVQSNEALAAANAEGYVVVHGDCPTVGIAGGYSQGGGTSPLSSLFGLAVDQVLEWVAVTAYGEVLTATPYLNSDLYWALTGGGGGTYAAVLSMTVKIHPNMATAGATLSFTEQDPETYWSVVQTFLMNLPGLLDAGGSSYWEVLPGNIFVTPQTYLPNGTADELESLFQPTLSALDQSGIPYGLCSAFIHVATSHSCGVQLTNSRIAKTLPRWTTPRFRTPSTR